jgi:hypothetical protein
LYFGHKSPCWRSPLFAVALTLATICSYWQDIFAHVCKKALIYGKQRFNSARDHATKKRGAAFSNGFAL